MAIRAEDIDLGSGAVDIDRDRLLVLRHQQGDESAFDELYRRYHARLVAFCQRRVGDRHTAEELAQEAFVKALRAMPGFAGERRFYPWMTVIAQRLCIDHHRRASRVEPAPEVDTGSVEADHDAVFAAVDHDHLDAALGRLAPRHREILDLREGRGWSYQQIAGHLDVPMTTVEALLHRARKALKREFLAVADDGRFGAALLGAGLLGRARRWLATAGGPERWAPVVGAAAVGTLAVGLVTGPLTDGAAGDTHLPPAATAAVAAAGPAARAATADPPASPLAPVPAPSPRRHVPEAEPAPAPVLGTPVASVATDRGSADAAIAENATQPLNAAVPGVADVGLDLQEAVTRLLDLGGNP